MTPATRTLSTAEERREAVLVAAEQVFAARGLHGTPTTEIAKAAGISHAYLFRLFPTKNELFVATVRRVNERLHATFREAAAEARAAGEDVQHALGQSYCSLLEDRTYLLIQMQANSASDDPEVRAAVRDSFAELVELVRRETGGADLDIANFFAKGMLLNVLAAVGANEEDSTPWVQTLMTIVTADDPA